MKKLKEGEYSIPPFIRVDDDRWSLAEHVTVAAWRKAQQIGTTDNLKHTLLQFRAVTQLLELAQEYALPEDAVVLPTLGLFNGKEDPDADLGLVEGADGIWRNRRDLEGPKLSLVENSSA
jgi:hypothetical protein